MKRLLVAVLLRTIPPTRLTRPQRSCPNMKPLLVALLLLFADAHGQTYLNPSAAVDARIDDLLGRMTLAEKIGQMTQAENKALTSEGDITTRFLGSLLSGGGAAPATNTPQGWADMYDRYQGFALKTRLAIPLLYGVDAVHGHNNVRGAVIFPHNIGLGCTRNPELVRQAAEITAHEVAGTGIDWTFAPCVAVPRDERWGRTYEGFAEMPDLTMLLGAAAIRGFQGNTLGAPERILACAKHYVGDGGTTGGKDQGNLEVDEATLRALHLPGYQAAIAAGVATIMTSYSSWNGVKLHGHHYLVTTVLKEELGFSGFVVSDYAGVDQIASDYKLAVETAINAGIDMVMVPTNYVTFINTLTALVTEGKVSQERIDDAVRRILRAKFQMGLFENPYTERSLTALVGSDAHRQVARACVRESMVLLAAKEGVLPLSRNATRIHVSGNVADNIGYQCGGWTISWQGGSGATTIGTTLLQAIRDAAPGVNVTYSGDGSGASGADVAIAFIGETPYAESQGDRANLTLPATVIAALRNLKAGGLPVVVVLISGRPLMLHPILPWCDALFAAWLPGSEGAGVAEVLFGDYAPSGRLSHSWPHTMEQIPINLHDPAYDPLYPYGHGITSYAAAAPGTAPQVFAAQVTEAGNEVAVCFNKEMADPPANRAPDWQASINGEPVAVTGVVRSAMEQTALVLTLDKAAEKNDHVTLAYAGVQQTSADGGVLAPFATQWVYNLLDEMASVFTLPCRVEAELFNSMSGVQTEATTDLGGGLNVGWIDAGDYMDYTIAVATGGTYRVDLRIAAHSAAGRVQLKNGNTVLKTIDLPVSGGWQNWQTVTTTIALPRSRFTLRVLAVKGGFNLNYIDFSLITGVEQSGSPPQQNALSANYPNPFNAATTIRYHTARTERVRIKIFDLRGALVATLVDGVVPAGSHHTTLSADHWPSGVYWCRMTAGPFSHSIKMALLK